LKATNTIKLTRVKKATLDMPKNIYTSKKMQIWHTEPSDEWSATLLDEIGTMMDLKQYVWEPDSETLTPFLTLEMIAKWRLDHHFALKKQDKTCQTMTPSPKPPEGGGTAGPSKK
jgi:hypothetical protein